MRSGVEQTSAGGALELGKNSEVDSERESMMPTENLSHTLVFSTWPPRWPFRFFPVVRGLDTPQAQVTESWLQLHYILHHRPDVTKPLWAEDWPLGC